MKCAMIGLGKMGANMTKRLLKSGHEIVVFDLNEEAIRGAEAGGAQGARTLEEAPLSDKLLAAMRQQFGGHAIKKEE